MEKDQDIGWLNKVFLVILALKVTDLISWSWWYVLAPIYGVYIANYLLVVLVHFISPTERKKTIEKPVWWKIFSTNWPILLILWIISKKNKSKV